MLVTLSVSAITIVAVRTEATIVTFLIDIRVWV